MQKNYYSNLFVRNLQDNNLIGKIPQDFGNLLKIEDLLVSYRFINIIINSF